MSYTSYRAICTCSLDGIQDADHATRVVVQTALTDPAFKYNIPADLATDNAEELFEEFRQYIEVNGSDEIVVTVDTEEGNFCTDFFDFITSILAAIHTGTRLEINWSTYDSREGISGGCDRYGPGGIFLDPANESKALNQIAELLCGDKDGLDPNLLQKIIKIVRSTGRRVYDKQEAC